MNSDRPPSAQLAYRNSGFLEGEEARPLRILAEYLEPLARFRAQGVRDTVVFFGSARLREDGPLGRYYRDARELARRLSEWSAALPEAGRFVVCSGGGGGIMEAANRGAVDAGGRSVGLNIGLPTEQRPNCFITPELSLEFHYFFMRKLWFAHLARALVAFPGGLGTLDELFEMLVLAQTGKLKQRPLVMLYGSEYWRKVIDFEALVEHGMIDRADLGLVSFVDDVGEAFALLVERLPRESTATAPAFASSNTSGSTLAP
jgi:uncharacterized protein (TIGR00730 family)